MSNLSPPVKGKFKQKICKNKPGKALDTNVTRDLKLFFIYIARILDLFVKTTHSVMQNNELKSQF